MPPSAEDAHVLTPKPETMLPDMAKGTLELGVSQGS